MIESDENKFLSRLVGIVKKVGYLITKIRNRLITLLAKFISFSLKTISEQLVVEIKEHLEIVVRLDYGPRDIYLYADSITEYLTRKNSSKKEPETVNWIETYIKPGDVVYDIGANIGAYSFIADRHADGLAKIYAFEPSFSTFAQLSRNIFINSCQGRIIPLCIALSNENGMATLNYSSLVPGAALHALGEPLNNLGQKFNPVYRQPVLSYRLDDLIQTLGLEKPNHIKLDVDGIELDILKGGDIILHDLALKSILVEVEPSLKISNQILEYLGECGFSISVIRSHGKSNMDTSNYLFVRIM